MVVLACVLVSGGCRAARTALTLDRLEVLRVTDLVIDADPVSARVEVALPASGPRICVDRLRWERDSRFVEGTRVGDCPTAGTQWLDVRASPAVLAAAFPDGARLTGPTGAVVFEGTVDGEPLRLQGQKGVAVTVGDGARVELAEGQLLTRATLRIAGLLPPTATVEVVVGNPMAAPVTFGAGRWALRGDGTELVSVGLRVPPSIPPGGSAPLAVHIGPTTALGAGLGLGGVLGGGALELRAEVEVQLEAVRVTVVATRRVGE